MTADATTYERLQERRNRVRKSDAVYGLDFVSVCPVSHVVTVHFLGQRPQDLVATDFVIKPVQGGKPLDIQVPDSDDRINNSPILKIKVVSEFCPKTEYLLTVAHKKEGPVASSGVESVVVRNSKPSLDPFFECLRFRFNNEETPAVDCLPAFSAFAPAVTSPEINYLAKDYATFRQLMLDRLAVTMPDWQERCPADVGMMLVEVLAYAADHLSYYQDAVGTEAYLGTARLRQSLRRHARLVDYRVHEGCNARAWMHLEASRDAHVSLREFYYIAMPGSMNDDTKILPEGRLQELLYRRVPVEVFEPVVSKPFSLWARHNECWLYDWSGAAPCLSPGSTSAWLLDEARAEGDMTSGLQFKKGDVVLFEEIRSPWTGAAADANKSHRHVVRITSVDRDEHDHLENRPLIRIHWSDEDALPFHVWISKPHNAKWEQSEEEERPLCVVRGNMLLVDHGRTIYREEMDLKATHENPPTSLQSYYPKPGVIGRIATSNLTYSSNLPTSGKSAAAQIKQDVRQATPQIVLRRRQNRDILPRQMTLLELRDVQRIAMHLLQDPQSDEAQALLAAFPQTSSCINRMQAMYGPQGQTETSPLTTVIRVQEAILDDLRNLWFPQYDLISSNSQDAHFVVEMTDERQSQLRFGRHGFGRTPDLSTDPTRGEMLANYRVGNGTTGNVPAEAICLFASHNSRHHGIRSVRNPLPAVGGVDPESPAEIRQFAPHAIRRDLKRAVTATDYERITTRHYGELLQKVKATLLWTGHEFKVLIVVDPKGKEEVDLQLLMRIRNTLHSYRRTGHTVCVSPAVRVVPALSLNVCLKPNVIREDVRTRLDQIFSNQVLPDGSLAFFHPDQVTFGDGIYVSQIIAAVTPIPGVLRATVTELHRADRGPAFEIENGVLCLKPHEIVRFDNNRQHPKSGILSERNVTIEGGR